MKLKILAVLPLVLLTFASCSKMGTCDACGNKNVKLFTVEDESGIKNLCSDCKKAYDIDRENEKILSDQNENVKGKKEYDWYSSLEQLETFIDDPEQYLVRVQIVFAYKKNDKKVSSEITAHRIEITDTLRNFFSKQTRESLKPINEKPLRLEILRLMNANIMENQKILDVRFTKLEVLQK